MYNVYTVYKGRLVKGVLNVIYNNKDNVPFFVGKIITFQKAKIIYFL
jgi:hypothetical protein